MTLLEKIQTSAVDSNSDLPTLLRNCRILAARLKNEEFRNWVQYELDGYRQGAELPDYREIHCESQGEFFGPSGILKNAPIPTIQIPEQFREFVSTIRLTQSVSALESLVRDAKRGQVHQLWPADLIAAIAPRVYQNMNMVTAVKILPSSSIIGVLNTVRNRILSFALEIEDAAPDAGEATSSPPLSTEKVEYVFNTTIMGNVGNLATGGSNISQTATINISQRDWKSLEDYLKSLGSTNLTWTN